MQFIHTIFDYFPLSFCLKGYIQVAVIRALCVVCISTYVVNLFLAKATLSASAQRTKRGD